MAYDAPCWTPAVDIESLVAISPQNDLFLMAIYKQQFRRPEWRRNGSPALLQQVLDFAHIPGLKCVAPSDAYHRCVQQAAVRLGRVRHGGRLKHAQVAGRGRVQA